MIKVQRIICGTVNCYIIIEDNNAILIDTAKEKYREVILAACRKANVKLIVLTHPHIDHCQNAAYLSQQLHIPIALCQLDLNLIEDNRVQSLYARTIFGKVMVLLSKRTFKKEIIPFFQPELFLEDGDQLDTYGVHARIIALYGHTKGSIGIDMGKEGVIVGDALMNIVSPGVAALYHDYDQMIQSARSISKLGERMVYFGHGKPMKNREWTKSNLV